MFEKNYTLMQMVIINLQNLLILNGINYYVLNYVSILMLLISLHLKTNLNNLILLLNAIILYP
jgi:hypothetical protein